MSRRHHPALDHDQPTQRGRSVTNGYITVVVPGHPHADARGRVYEHVLVAEAALGRPLPEGVQVHHVDEDTTRNCGGNLVICQDVAYHQLLHVRQRALDACGNPGWRKCFFCRRFDALDQLVVHAKNAITPTYIHPACRRTKYAARRRAA